MCYNLLKIYREKAALWNVKLLNYRKKNKKNDPKYKIACSLSTDTARI
jgi:hypothetical protein